MTYIKEPIILEYGTRDIYSISSSETGHLADDSLKYGAIGVVSFFASAILK
jgi:hypothetical protein